ncbi:MAG TPA: PP2C family protein-serine/threonine phosphatase [Pseudomonadota bacterium]|nr:PP2C family protein-serine/threonine phosphatase [Pseudomonadota bacterium]
MMSEHRIPLFVGALGLLCLLLQLILSVTDSGAQRAQSMAQKVAQESVQLRSEKRAERLSLHLQTALQEGDQAKVQMELELASLAAPDLVEIGVVDHDLSVVASSEKNRIGKPMAGVAENLLREAVAQGFVKKAISLPQQQRVILAQPLTGQPGSQGLLYLVLATGDMEEGLSKVLATLRPQRVPPWLTILLGMAGVCGALAMWFVGERRRNQQAMMVQEVAEQMAMGHFETRLLPQEVPAFAAIAERLNMMADQVVLLQQTQIEGTVHTSKMAQELQDAQIVQQTLMPEVRRISRGPLQLCGVYRSASKLSGDWWHYYPLDDTRTMLVMADVVGHGIGSAVVGAMAYGCAQQLHAEQGPKLRPELLLTRLNHAICSTMRDKFTMSCFAAIIDIKECQITFASGAHAFPLLFRHKETTKPFIPLVAAGSPLGSTENAKFVANTQPFEPGDILICYTDGLIEAVNSNSDPFGDKRVRQTVQRSSNRNVEEICEMLIGEVSRFVGSAELEDDQTLVVARHGSPSYVGV